MCCFICLFAFSGIAVVNGWVIVYHGLKRVKFDQPFFLFYNGWKTSCSNVLKISPLSRGTDRGVSESLLWVETTVQREKPSIRPEDPKPSPMQTPGIELLSFFSNRRKKVRVTFQVYASTHLQVGKFCKHCSALTTFRTVQILAQYDVFIMCAILHIGRVLTFC